MDTPRMILEKKLYTASATASSGRDGRAVSDDGKLDVVLRPPKEMGGSGGPGTNPEQLFAAGYAACFGGAYGLAARRKKVTTGPVSITARVALGPVGTVFAIAVELSIRAPQLARAQAEELMRDAHEICPYSNATRGNIAVDLKVEEAR